MPANRLSTQLTHSAFIFHSHIIFLFVVLLTRRRHFSLDSAIHILLLDWGLQLSGLGEGVGGGGWGLSNGGTISFFRLENVVVHKKKHE